jgi:hypothetical protein
MNVSATRKGDGIVRIQDGAFTGDGTVVTVNLGFVPSEFILINQTDVVTFQKLRGMAAANCIKVIAAGTMTLDTSSAVVINADGTVTISAATNIAAKSFVFLAQ